MVGENLTRIQILLRVQEWTFLFREFEKMKNIVREFGKTISFGIREKTKYRSGIRENQNICSGIRENDFVQVFWFGNS